MDRYARKSVIVTGAGNGIGLRYAEAFAAEGASVTIADIDGASFLTGQTVTVDGGYVRRV